MKSNNPDNPKAFQPSRIQDLDLISFTSVIRQDNKGHVWDPIRKKWLVRTPEEMVRLAVVHALNQNHDISFRRMAAERGLERKKDLRFDIVIFNEIGHPHLLVECKSPEFQLRTEHIIQVGSYNEDLKAPYVMLTNGINSVLIDLESQEFLTSLSKCFS